MRPLFLVVVLCGPAVAVSVAHEEGAAAEQESRVTVSGSVASPTAGIQEAVDVLGRGGGVVTLPPGEYLLRQTIHLRSNVTIQGAGPTTVLRKPKSAETRLAAVAEKGSTSVRVKDPKGFAPSDQVAIRDGDAQGWNVVQAIVKGVEGNQLLLDRAMPRTCDPAKGGFVVHAFPAIEANEASRIIIKDLTIRDDNVRDLSVHGPLDLNNPRSGWVFIVPFPVAAISLVGCADSRVEGVTVVGWLSDGISLQRGANNTAR